MRRSRNGVDVWILLLALSLLLQEGVCVPRPRFDPDTGRIRVMNFGSQDLAVNAYQWDPMLYVRRIPAYSYGMGPARVQRSLRMYMPRTLKNLEQQNDILIFTDTDSANYRPDWLQWFRTSVEEEGLGLIMTAGGESFGGVTGYGIGWIPTPINDILPVESIYMKTWSQTHVMGGIKVEIVDPGHELMKALPYNKIPPLGPQNDCKEKAGAHTLMKAISDKGWPVYAYMDIENSRTTAFTAHHGVGTNFWKWEYFMDHFLNMIYWTCRMKIPEDPELVHLIRNTYKEYTIRKAFAYSVIEFIDTFGANTLPLEKEIIETFELREISEKQYIGQEYETSLATINQAIDRLKQIAKESTKLKERALLWVYIIQYLAVTGTSMVAAVLLWTLMVRRRLYREVVTTRFDGR